MPAGSSRRMAHMTALCGSCFQQRRASFTKPSPSKGTDVPWIFCHASWRAARKRSASFFMFRGRNHRLASPLPPSRCFHQRCLARVEISSGRWELSFSKTMRACSPSISRQVTAVLSAWPSPSISPGPRHRTAAWRQRMAVPWENRAMVCPGWSAASRNTVSLIRACTWAKVSPPRTRNSGELWLKRIRFRASSRSSMPQGLSSHTPTPISRRPGVVWSSRPWLW